MLSITKGKRIVTILLICVFAILSALSLNHKYRGEVLHHNLEQITPFHTIETTVYDLGGNVTATETVETQNTVISVRHSDRHLFSEEQWNVILSGIEDGSIFWED
ncbi:hypothetical protein [Flavonifractor sp. An9]|uniref:hypothetical protein n=1 Tax=Flavonifractor sp. An9 TaxID=1965664 RepID=UPI000B586432|nr:hypothetical protein [Flavonifractor sp. An9]OUN12025.1 hypothetical protein B5G40_04965 [Flavonifractor sp. An9]